VAIHAIVNVAEEQATAEWYARGARNLVVVCSKLHEVYRRVTWVPTGARSSRERPEGQHALAVGTMLYHE